MDHGPWTRTAMVLVRRERTAAISTATRAPSRCLAAPGRSSIGASDPFLLDVVRPSSDSGFKRNDTAGPADAELAGPADMEGRRISFSTSLQQLLTFYLSVPPFPLHCPSLDRVTLPRSKMTFPATTPRPASLRFTARRDALPSGPRAIGDSKGSRKSLSDFAAVNPKIDCGTP
ncbi:hypothetical protein BDZ45DRAFT_211613 [Acephala macrosclerotiorum]|nr:hypothetical protein BDZ45DRAFT_211613 [Acephala macrosclerotiorum]